MIIHGKTREQIKTLSKQVRSELGKALLELQEGKMLGMPMSRPMPQVSSGSHELRFKDEMGTYRIFYFTKSKRGILVFHAFVKKTQKTPVLELELARKRLKEMLNEEN